MMRRKRIILLLVSTLALALGVFYFTVQSARTSPIEYTDTSNGVAYAQQFHATFSYRTKQATFIGNWFGVVQQHPDLVLLLRDPKSKADDSAHLLEIFKYAGFDCLFPVAHGDMDEQSLDEIVQQAESLGYEKARMLMFTQSLDRDWILEYANKSKLRGLVLTGTDIGCLEHIASRLLPINSVRHDSIPLLLFHGDHDQVVDYRGSIRCYDLAPHSTSKRLVILNSIGHHDLYYSDQFIANLVSMFPSQMGTSDTLPNVRW